MIRTPEALIPYVFMLAAVLGGMLWHAGDEVPGLGRTIMTGRANIGGPFALIDQNGQTRTDKSFRKTWMLVYFGYTDCPDVCPITLSLMADTLDKLGPRSTRITPIFVTIDPARDTPKVMKQYVSAFGPRFVGLTGATAAIAKVASEYRVYFRKHDLSGGNYAMDHSGTIYLMDPSGKFATDYDEAEGPEKIAADLRRRL